MGLLNEDAALRKLGEETLERCLQILRSDSWKMEKKSTSEDKVSSINLPDVGKLYLVEAVLNFPPKFLHDLIFDGVGDLHKWNKQFIASQRLKSIDPNTDITHIVTASLVSGLVASRDFVCVRHCREVEGTYFAAGCSIEHSLAPLQRNYIRGETKLSIFAIHPVPGKPDWSRFQWINCARLGGWLPQYVVELFFTDGMLDYVRYLRQFSDHLRREGCF
ncbi:steroidogenic acute regulatory protein, mitochondrial [Anabrus simplex]|uniref:steroidogenic acute regulatory protein, mitochondrial n=1 Tax=Anabrus simplex TaxID=316456 RepID=UPI0035A2E852